MTVINKSRFIKLSLACEEMILNGWTVRTTADGLSVEAIKGDMFRRTQPLMMIDGLHHVSRVWVKDCEL